MVGAQRQLVAVKFAKLYHFAFAFAVRYEAVSAGFVDCQDCAAGALL